MVNEKAMAKSWHLPVGKATTTNPPHSHTPNNQLSDPRFHCTRPFRGPVYCPACTGCGCCITTSLAVRGMTGGGAWGVLLPNAVSLFPRTSAGTVAPMGGL
ncbi:hypothetical protein M3J09_009372 [Ascochyta lentis]